MKPIFTYKTAIILSVLGLVFFPWQSFAVTELAAVAISGGENHTLVLSNGQVFGCGENKGWSRYFGVLGTGDKGHDEEWRLVHVHAPDNLGFLDNISDISAGWMHCLALSEDRCVWSWGEGSYGRLGNGVNYREPFPDDPIYGDGETTPVRVVAGDQDPNDPNSPLRHIIAISAGRSGMFSLALDANGVCYAFGRNNKGQLGNGTTTNSNVPKEVNDTYNIGTLQDVVAVSAGEENSMALDANHFVWTWGDGAYGKLGNGADDDERTPVKVHGVNDVNFLENIVAISAGWDHCMALEGHSLQDANICGRVFCWGNNDMGYYSGQGGRLGNGENTGSKSTPVIVKAGQQDPNNTNSYLKNVVAISAGESHSMALDASGRVLTWGDNDFGQLGTANYNDYNTPVKVVAPDRDGDGYSDDLDGNSLTVEYLGDDIPIVKISAGYWHSLCIDQQGNLYSWGMGLNGRLSLGDTEDYNIPREVGFIAPPVRNLTQNLEYFEIQPAIDDTKAEPDDVIEADPCTYNENVSFGSKALTLRSTNPQDWGVVAGTVVQGADDTAVTFGSESVAVISGFTISSTSDGFYCHLSQGTIDHCIIEDNGGDGIESFHSSMTITNNIIRNNTYHGIYMQDSVSGVPAPISNNWIYGNGTDDYGDGIYMNSMDSQAVIRNNTIAYNEAYGIQKIGGTTPAVSNCIVWDNGSAPFSGISTVNYCCYNQQGGISGTGNTNTDPCLAGADNLHILPGSVCIDAGDPNFTADANEADIDNEARVIDGNNDGIERVDMGADEMYDSRADFDDSNWVNWVDFSMFAPAWATESGDPNYNDLYDLEDDNVIDYQDLSLFCDDWLWEAAWASSQQMMMSIGRDDNLESISMESVATAAVKLEVPQPIWLNRPQIDPQQRAAFVEDALDWLDGVWENEELGDIMTYEQYIEFRESIRLFAEE